MPQLEAWEQVYVSNAEFLDDVHGELGCTACHGGDATATDMEGAHTDVVTHPDDQTTCGTCHAEIAEHSATSLHSTLGGYLAVLGTRATDEAMPALTEAYDNHCAECHTTCGQCHVSRPASNGGGLLDGHAFKQTPPMNQTCVGCHGSRVENEFKGRNVLETGESVPADVHFNPNGMPCFACHAGEQMHGSLEMGAVDRYDGDVVPACEDCHPDLVGANAQHTEHHLEELACQVCHSVAYKNCYSCHVQLSDEGVPYFRTEPSEMGLYIGRNFEQSESRPWSWVVVRHVPIDRESFSFYGDDLLRNFDARPTWAYATPHSIQPSTPQNASCTACHGNPDVFLTADKVAEAELEANREVIVQEVPSLDP